MDEEQNNRAGRRTELLTILAAFLPGFVLLPFVWNALVSSMLSGLPAGSPLRETLRIVLQPWTLLQ